MHEAPGVAESPMTPRAADGSPVELYARLPSLGEPELVHAAIPDGVEILELGSGAGRMTHRLVELGHPVTAVDSSPEMLAHVRAATTVEADISGLDLGRTFGCVLLASQLVNTDDDRERADLLAACARHVASDGVVLIQRYDPDWATDPRPSETIRDGVTIRVIEARREEERLVAAVEYVIDGRTWRHGPFASRIFSDEELEDRLRTAGLVFDRWLDERRTWLAARPGPDVSGLYAEIAAAEPLVAAYRRRWDAAGTAVPAHVTIHYPFLDPARIDKRVEAQLAEIVAATPAFDVRFERVGRFPDVVWLAPEPQAPLSALTEAITRSWPDHQPYGGRFPEVVHHLTVADGAPAPILERIEAELAAALPIQGRIDELTLSVRQSGTWRVHGTYPLGRGEPAPRRYNRDDA